jgi:hypothetical protein
MTARSKPELGTVRFRLMREDSDDGKKGRAQQCDPSNQPAIRLLLFLCCSASLLQISNSLFFLCIYIILHRLHSRCWKYYSTTPAGTPSRGILSLSPASPPVFILLFQRCPFGFCSDDDSALEAAVFSTYVTARIYFMSFPHQQAPTTEWHRPAFLFLHPN